MPDKDHDQQQDPRPFERRDRARRTHAWRRPSYRERRREQAMMDWYGTTRGILEMARGRPVKMAGDVVDEVLEKMGRSSAALLASVAARWEETVGRDIARRSRPVAMTGNVLSVEVDNATWQFVLEREHRGRILQWLKENVSEDIDDVRFVPRGRRRR